MTSKSKIIFTFFLSIVILILIGIYTYTSINDYRNSTAYAHHSQKIITEAQKTLTAVQGIESLQRGYVITGDEKYRVAFKDGLKKVGITFSATKQLTKNNFKQQPLIDSIQNIISLKIYFANKVVRERQVKGFESAKQLVASGTGELLMNKLRKLIGDFISHENDALSLKVNDAVQSFSITINVIIASITLTIFIVVVTLYFFIRDYNRRIYSENQLKLSNDRFFKIFNKNSVGMAITNMETSKLEYVNESFSTIFGYTEQEVVGKTSQELNLVSNELRDETISMLKKKGYLKAVEGEIRKKNGEKLWVLLSLEIIEINEKKYILSSIYDMHERKELEEKIRKLAEFQNIILNGTDYAIITTSYPEGIITTFNTGAEKMLGYMAEEVVGKTDPSIIHDKTEVENRAKLLSQELQMKIEPGIDVFHIKSRLGYNIDINEWTYICKDGSRINVELSITTLRDKDKNIVGYLGVAKNISENKKAREAILLAKEAAEQSNLLKETFLANMSHEIRTPMNAIIGFTDLLLKKDLKDREKEFVRIIKTSGENLLRIINDILDVSKIDSGMMIFEEHPISIKEIFGSIHIMLSQKAKEKDLTLNFEYDSKLPDVVLGDPTRLTQIILNLVGNGIKFTKEGGVDVFAKTLSQENEIYVIEFSIKDTGIGIPEDKLQQVFERFKQAESHTTRNYGGTGLGLNIAKQLIELQNGTINIKSTEGIGTVFSFILPFKKTNKIHQNTHQHNIELDVLSLSKLNVLVVEDNSINITFIKSLFSDYNIKSDIAENGRVAIEKLKNNQYDIVLMDIEMPEMNGYEATEAIRNDLKNNIPIIAMTAHAMSGEKEKCIQLGMNDYISKPINTDLLFEKILYETKSKAAERTLVNLKNNVINLDFIIKTMRGKKEVILNIIDIFLREVPKDLLAINKAVNEADYLTIKNHSHKLKSSVSLMGIIDLKSVLNDMESLSKLEKDLNKIKQLNEVLHLKCNLAVEELKIEKINYV